LPNEGETLTRFTVQPGDVLMADRGLAHRRGIRYVKDHGGDVVVRLNLVGVPLEDNQGQPFDILSAVRTLVVGEVGNWQALIRDERGTLPVRVCALRKTEAQTLKSQEKLRKTAARKNRQLQPETLEVAGFVLVLTTLDDTNADDIMELYRYRWQIELAFKRLKSLLQLGHLKKTDPEGAKAWLQGKLFVAALIEMLIAVGERFPLGVIFAMPA
jgi:IS4 transposase